MFTTEQNPLAPVKTNPVREMRWKATCMIHIYITIETKDAPDELRRAYFGPQGSERLKALLAAPVNQAFGQGDTPVKFDVSNRVSMGLGTLRVDNLGNEAQERIDSLTPGSPETLIIPLRIDETNSDIVVNEQTLEALTSRIPGARTTGADLVFETAYVPEPAWCGNEGLGRGFGTRADALKMIHQDFLSNNGLDGSNVNVVIVDQGLNGRMLGSNFAGGWPVNSNGGGVRLPGQLQSVRGVTNNEHGMLIARNVLAVAPQVRLFDCPLIPDRIRNVPIFLSTAHAVLDWVLTWVGLLQDSNVISGPWVVVNAWAIFDRSTETPPGHYSENSAHGFNQLMRGFTKNNIDVVFAAGNCGHLCPDRRCRPHDTGPDQSIFGAHAHASVLTVGAIRADGLWAGASSQGRGPEDKNPTPAPETERLARKKPDLCGPSFFTEPYDRHIFNGGTSTASAIVAGAIAALRSARGFDLISTDGFFEELRQAAYRSGAPRWDDQLGFGVLNVETAFNRVRALITP
jgi:hypothetical protein